MRSKTCWLTTVFAVTLLFAVAQRAAAERAVFHYVPAGPDGALQLQPIAEGAAGERVDSLGKVRGTLCQAPQPACNMTLMNPCNGQKVIVPLALPEDTPIIRHVQQGIVYDYGTYRVEVRFLPGGGVDVIYNSILRPISFPTASPGPPAGPGPEATLHPAPWISKLQK
jgi:hypothetical protein